ncbi:MAG: hypothetical protein V1849_00445 [Chloroflexota bacterium]
MTTTEFEGKEKLCQFIKEYEDDQYCLEILHFLGRHPSTRFSRSALFYALKGGRLYLERALKRLISQRLLKLYTRNNEALYSLTEDSSLRALVAELARLEWCQWQQVLAQSHSPAEEAPP